MYTQSLYMVDLENYTQNKAPWHISTSKGTFSKNRRRSGMSRNGKIIWSHCTSDQCSYRSIDIQRTEKRYSIHKSIAIAAMVPHQPVTERKQFGQKVFQKGWLQCKNGPMATTDKVHIVTNISKKLYPKSDCL